MMKQFLKGLLFVAVLPFMVGCQSDSPEATAQEFLNSFYQMDFEKAISLSTPKQAELVKQVEQFESITSDSVKASRKNVQVDIVNVEVNGDHATITYTNLLEPSESTLNMIREDGKWLANNSKEDIVSDLEDDSSENNADSTNHE